MTKARNAQSMRTIQTTGQQMLMTYPHKKNQVVSTSEAPRGYPHHSHIEKERNNSRNKRKNKNGRECKPRISPTQALTQGNHKVSSPISWKKRKKKEKKNGLKE